MAKKLPGLGESPAAAFKAARKILRPLVKYLIARGITYPALVTLLKAIYVEVAVKEFPLQEKGATDSRVSMLTGVHRAEVKRLVEQIDHIDEITPPSVSMGAQIAARWISDPIYLDRAGNPKPLARYASDGGELSFEALVACISKDIRARSILDEWLRLEVVEVDEQSRVCLRTKAYVPKAGGEEKNFYFSQNLHDHIATSVNNLLEDAPPLLERSVYYNKLTSASIETLQKLSTEVGARAIQDINRLAIQLDRLDDSHPYAKYRMNFGVYFYHSPNQDAIAKKTVESDTPPESTRRKK